MKRISRAKSFEGFIEVYEHSSEVTKTPMRFSVFVPPVGTPVKAVLYWLSGLTCTEENFMVKSGCQRLAAERGLMLIAPDTSPRGAGIPGEADSWDFGLAAGFYVNATQAPWSKNYRMYDYVLNELRENVNTKFGVANVPTGISGHSMGGHGALVLGLRNPQVYASISAFAPIVAPMRCPWGQKAFRNYLGEDQSTWKAYDTTELIKSATVKRPLLVDQGTDDKWMTEQLKPELLEAAAKEAGHPMTLRYQPGYDHGYYFVSTFLEDHFDFHLRNLA